MIYKRLICSFWIILLSGASMIVCPRQALSKDVKGLEVLSTGSLIIPMDIAKQNDGTNKFNLKSYGLVVHLLVNKIPVKRVIAAGKSDILSVDITALSRKIFPSTSTAQLTAYTGGPFVVEKSYASAAKTFIASYSSQVSVYELTTPATVNVAYTLTNPPRLGIISNGGFKDYHIDIVKAGGISTYDVISAESLKSTDCFTMVSASNWEEGVKVSSSIATSVKNYVKSGGNFFAQNWAIIAFEAEIHFQTMGGKGFNQTGNISSLTYKNLDNPFIQTDEGLHNDNGNFSSYGPDNTTLRNGIVEIIKDPKVRKYKATTIKHSSTSFGGNVYYLAGSYNISSNEKISGSRLFLNALLTPAERPSSCTKSPDLGVSIITNQASVCRNSPFQHKVIIRNTGNARADHIVIKVSKDSKVQFNSASVSAGVFNPTGFNWNVPSLNPDERDTLILNLTGIDPLEVLLTSYVNKLPGDINTENDTAKVSIRIHPLPAANAGADRVICEGENTSLGRQTSPSLSYRWSSIPAGFNSSKANPTVTSVTNTYYILTVKDQNSGCEKTDSVYVKTVKCLAPDVSISAITDKVSLCEKDMFRNKVIITNIGDTTANNIIIENLKDSKAQYSSAVTTSGIFDSSDFSWRVPALNVGESDTLTVHFIGREAGAVLLASHINRLNNDINNTNDTAKTSLQIHPLPIANAGPDRFVCTNEYTSLGGQNSPSLSFDWSSSPAGFTSAIASPNARASENTYYILTVTDQNTGCQNTDSVFIKLTPPPSLSAAGKDTALYIREVNLSGSKPIIGTGEWSIVEGSGKIINPSDPHTKVTNLGIGQNKFQWTISNFPCESNSDEVKIEIMELIIPTTFTPNNDGINDTFVIEGLQDLHDNFIQVFNRWGNMVYSKKGYENDWNGTTRDGKKLSEDTYYCTVEINGKTVHKKYLIIKR